MVGKGVRILWEMEDVKILGEIAQEVTIEKATFELRPNFSMCTL